jgi:hypothetical protein
MLADGVVVELLRRQVVGARAAADLRQRSGRGLLVWVCLGHVLRPGAKQTVHCKLHGTLKRPSCLSRNRWGSGALSPSPEKTLH